MGRLKLGGGWWEKGDESHWLWWSQDLQRQMKSVCLIFWVHGDWQESDSSEMGWGTFWNPKHRGQGTKLSQVPKQTLCRSRWRAGWVLHPLRVSFPAWLGTDHRFIDGHVGWLSIIHKGSLGCFRQAGRSVQGLHVGLELGCPNSTHFVILKRPYGNRQLW